MYSRTSGFYFNEKKILFFKKGSKKGSGFFAQYFRGGLPKYFFSSISEISDTSSSIIFIHK